MEQGLCEIVSIILLSPKENLGVQVGGGAVSMSAPFGGWTPFDISLRLSQQFTCKSKMKDKLKITSEKGKD